jgi:hypothetical protein
VVSLFKEGAYVGRTRKCKSLQKRKGASILTHGRKFREHVMYPIESTDELHLSSSNKWIPCLHVE